MKYGVFIFPTEYAISPEALAKGAEDRGFESLWVAEHTHIPACRSTPWPGGPDMPQMYNDTYDPMLALTAAAAVTSTIKLATGISLVIQHHPLTLAKQVATLDRISNGRFMFGVGGGWNKEEIENHGTPFKRRWKVMRERIEAMKAVWTQDEAEYHGEFVDFDPVRSWPKPVQKPHPPIHIGGAAPWATRRVVRYGDGWMPILGRGSDDLAEQIAQMRKDANEAGRDGDAIEVSIYGAPADADRLSGLADIGVQRIVFGLPPAGEDVVLPLLDRYAEIARKVG